MSEKCLDTEPLFPKTNLPVDNIVNKSSQYGCHYCPSSWEPGCQEPSQPPAWTVLARILGGNSGTRSLISSTWQDPGLSRTCGLWQARPGQVQHWLLSHSGRIFGIRSGAFFALFYSDNKLWGLFTFAMYCTVLSSQKSRILSRHFTLIKLQGL